MISAPTLKQAAAELCREYPDAPSRTLAKRLAVENKTSVENARAAIRAVRGALGESKLHKSVPELRRAKQSAGWVPKMPPTKAGEWLPLVVAGPGRVGIISDLHVPFHSELALESAVEHIARHRPDVILINGDFGDWYGLSRFEKNPKLRDDQGELNAQRQCLQWLRHRFKKQRIIFKYGNHDERWDKYVFNVFPLLHAEPGLRLDTMLKCAELDVEVVMDQRPIMLGKLPVFHGHELGRSIFNPVNPARGAFLRTHHTILVGHNHQTSGHGDTNIWHDETFCWSTGCLCCLTPEYARVNRWNWGAAFVTVEKDGTFGVENFRISKDGKARSS